MHRLRRLGPVLASDVVHNARLPIIPRIRAARDRPENRGNGRPVDLSAGPRVPAFLVGIEESEIVDEFYPPIWTGLRKPSVRTSR